MTNEEMSRIIAEKVMGWKFHWGYTEDEPSEWRDIAGEFQRDESSWDPPGNITQAIKAIEKFCDDREPAGWYLRRPLFAESRLPGHWHVALIWDWESRPEDWCHEFFNNDPALAICDALVKAVSDD